MNTKSQEERQEVPTHLVPCTAALASPPSNPGRDLEQEAMRLSRTRTAHAPENGSSTLPWASNAHFVFVFLLIFLSSLFPHLPCGLLLSKHLPHIFSAQPPPPQTWGDYICPSSTRWLAEKDTCWPLVIGWTFVFTACLASFLPAKAH